MNRSEKKDRFFRNLMLITGILAAVFFIVSLISLIEFPGSFKFLAIGMILCTIAFFIIRTVFNFRNTFRVREKK